MRGHGLRGGQRAGAVVRHLHPVAADREERGEHVGGVLIVVDDEYAQSLRRDTVAGGRRRR